MRNRFSTEVKESISLSAEEAVRLGSPAISAGHLLLGLVRQGHNEAVSLLTEDLHIPLPALVAAIEETLPANQILPQGRKWRLPLDRGAEKAIRGSVAEAKRSGSRTIDARHLLYSLYGHRENEIYRLFGRWGIGGL